MGTRGYENVLPFTLSKLLACGQLTELSPLKVFCPDQRVMKTSVVLMRFKEIQAGIRAAWI